MADFCSVWCTFYATDGSECNYAMPKFEYRIPCKCSKQAARLDWFFFCFLGFKFECGGHFDPIQLSKSNGKCAS